MNNYGTLQKYLERNGNTIVKLSFDNLKEILEIEVDYVVALRIQKDFHCSYMVDGISKKGKWVSFCRTKMQKDNETAVTLASMLWW